VARWIDPDGSHRGGEDGIPLTKLAPGVYQNRLNPNTILTVSPERLLSIVSESDTTYGQPCEELWPL
jgi:hypothetical protein